MPIPDFQACMLPFLLHLADGVEHTPKDTEAGIAHKFDLTQEELSALLPSGQMTVFKSRVGWARTYLKKAGLLDSPKRGVYVITQRGRDVLAQNPQYINIKFLEQFPEFVAFQNASKSEQNEDSGSVNEKVEIPPSERPLSSHTKSCVISWQMSF